MNLNSLCSDIFKFCDLLDQKDLYRYADKLTNIAVRISQTQNKPNWMNNSTGVPQLAPQMKINPPPNLSYQSQKSNYQLPNELQPQQPKPTYDPSHLPKTATPFEDAFVRAAQATGYPVSLLLSLSNAESTFNPKAKSSVGAYGLMQLYPATPAQQKDPTQNIMGGARLLRSYHDALGTLEGGLAAYNWGITNMRRVKGDYRKAPRGVQMFVAKVLNGQKNYV